MNPKPTWYYFAPALIGLGMLLVAANAYVHPERMVPWAVAFLGLGSMTVILAVVSRGANASVARRRGADSVRSGIVFAGLILVFTLGVTLVSVPGSASREDISERGVMAILGAFLVFTGNAIPKTLSHSSASPEHTAKVQALQRFSGWTWVLAGLAFAIGSLVLPRRLADPMTFVLIPAAMLLILVQCIRAMVRQRAA